MTRRRWTRSLGLAGWLAAGICVSVSVLTWFGYRAIREWQRSSVQLVERRANETASLLVTALSHDMSAVHKSVLSSVDRETFQRDPPHDLSIVVASAFARYPYPELFFACRDAPAGSVVFFMRSDRPPPWAVAGATPSRFPVVMQTDPQVGRAIARQIGADAQIARKFSLFPLTQGGTEYQVIARLFYRDELRQELVGAFGFMVDIPWVRAHYFPELTSQILQIGGTAGLALSLIDERQQRVTDTAAIRGGGPLVGRSFPLMFFDPLLVAVDQPAEFAARRWTVEVGGAADPTLTAAIHGADRTLLLAAFAAATLAFGLVLTSQAVGASARLSELRSEFVATVTHELKTPIATIRAAGDTLLSGRIPTPGAQREYAQLVVQEAKRLTRLVENLLAMSRITDVTEVYLFEPVGLARLVQATLQEFAQPLEAAGFDLETRIPPDLPPVRGDWTAMTLLLDNLVDNAIRYSTSVRSLTIGAHVEGGRVILEVTDRGCGIPREELDQVTRKFFRGRHPVANGSGLGLAIVKRIVADHGGELAIESEVQVGTTVRVSLPTERADEETDSRR